MSNRDEDEARAVLSDEQGEATEKLAHRQRDYESSGDGSDDSYGKLEREVQVKRRRRKEKERLREEQEAASAEPAPAPLRQPSAQPGRARGDSGAPGPSRAKAGPKAKASDRPLAKHRDVTTGFDSSDPTDSSSEDNPSDDESNNAGKGKRRAGGRPPAEALVRCDALGESTRAEANAIAQEYNLHPQTVLVRAGLALKATKVRNVSNTVRKVFAHEYRLKHNGGTFNSHAYYLS